jgi:hypothetical protein
MIGIGNILRFKSPLSILLVIFKKMCNFVETEQKSKL